MVVVRGCFDDCKIDLPPEYFRQRSIKLDCRGMITIHRTANISRYVYICTGSHDPSSWSVVTRPVTIEAGAWIGSSVILYNTTIGEDAIVAIGSVVRSVDVPPKTMVEGNPVRIIAKRVKDLWVYLDEPEELKR